MPEALARSRSDFVLSRPQRRSRKTGGAKSFFSRLRSIPGRVLVGAGLSAVFAGIAVNALMLQSHRHPAPFFASGASGASAPTASGSDAPLPASAAILPPPRPVPAPHADDSAATPRVPTTIDDLLNANSSSEESKLAASAQNALVKLGYLPKTESASPAALQRAAREFERAHGLPQTADITPRLVKQLNASANGGGR